MKLTIKVTQFAQQQKTSLIIGIYEDGSLTDSAKQIDKASKGALTYIIKQSAFEAKLGQTLPIFHLEQSDFQSILLVGCGEKSALTPIAFRKIISSAVKNAAYSAKTEATLYLTELPIKERSLQWKIKQITEIAEDSLYSFDYFKAKKAPLPTLKTLIIHVSDKNELKASEKALLQGQAIASGVTFTKDLANLPSNICTPAFLAEEAKILAKRYQLKIKILNEKEMHKLGMGAILAVSKGSAEDAKLIVLQYKGAKSSEAPVALVGKGITFDTGGNSLKSPDNMVGMKYDMCGGATVLGVMRAVAILKLPINLVGIIPAVENMPGGTAYKPEDILTSMSGQTIEVISTDAEGRLILADALTYCERFKPDVVIDIATLTGAIVIALGDQAIGLFSNNDALAEDLLQAGTESNDRAWQLPLWDEYQELIKSPFADLSNVGGRSAGSITAACFLSHFAQSFRWAHLDVAGTAAHMMNDSRRMATGRPVPLIMQYLINRTQK